MRIITGLAIFCVATLAAILLYDWTTEARSLHFRAATASPSAPAPGHDKSQGAIDQDGEILTADVLADAPVLSQAQRIEREAFDLGTESVEKALERLSRTNEPSDRAAMIKWIFEAAAQQDWAAAIRLVKRLSDPTDSEMAMRVLASALRGGEAFQVPQVFIPPDKPMSISGELGRFLLNGKVNRVEFAITWANELLQGDERISILAAAAAATADNNRSLALADSLTGADRSSFLKKYAGIYAQSPHTGWHHARLLPEGSFFERQPSFRSVIFSLEIVRWPSARLKSCQ